MIKHALLGNASPAELFGGTALMGGGMFSAAALLQELLREPDPTDPDILQLDVPEEQAQLKQAQEAPPAAAPAPEPGATDPASLSYDVLKLLALVGGPPLGFMGAKSVFDSVKRSEGEASLEASRNRYMRSLEQLKQGEATPLLDEFCAGLAENFEKDAGVGAAIKRTGSGVWEALTRGSKYQQAAQQAGMESILKNKSDAMPFGREIAIAAAATTLASALIAGGVMVKADKKKDKAQAETQFPHRVEFAP